MKKQKFIAGLTVCALLFSSVVPSSQALSADPIIPRQDYQVTDDDSVRLHQSVNGKIYRALQLLQGRQWRESYELLRQVLKYDRTEKYQISDFFLSHNRINDIARKKVEEAFKIIGSFPMKERLNDITKGRYEMQPFLKAQLLLNEALMDNRIAINTSNDSEIWLIRALLQSYFFPGAEKLGKIIYPDPKTYAYSLYALTPENTAKAETERSYEPLPGSEPDPVDPTINPNNPSDQNNDENDDQQTTNQRRVGSRPRGRVILRQRHYFQPSVTPSVINDIRGPLPNELPSQNPDDEDPTDSEEEDTQNMQTSPQGSPLGGQGRQGYDDYYDVVDCVDPTSPNFDKAVCADPNRTMMEGLRKIIKQMFTRLKKEATNRYLPESLMVQALTEPGAAALDPQIRTFLKGVRLQLDVGSATGSIEFPTSSEITQLRKLVGASVVDEAADGTLSINLDKLTESRTDPRRTQSLGELRLVISKVNNRGALHVISTIGGADLFRMRVMQTAATFLSEGFKTSRYGVAVAANATRANEVLTVLLTKTQQLAAALRAETGSLMRPVVTVKNVLGAALSLSTKAGQAAQYLAAHPKLQKLLSRITNHKFVNSTSKVNLINTLVVVAIAAQVGGGAIEYFNATSPDDKSMVWNETAAQVGATLLYLVPIVGWGAAAVDLTHFLLQHVPGVDPINTPETADAFRAAGWMAGELALKYFHGLNHTTLKLKDLENAYNIPRDNVLFTRFGKQIVNPADRSIPGESLIDDSVMALLTQMQDTAVAYLTVIYLAHRTVAPDTNRDFGKRIESYIKAFEGNRTATERVMRFAGAVRM